MTAMIKSKSGFTIVELLIVIVVIAILATISIVAYTGVQNRARTNAGTTLASKVGSKVDAYRTLYSSYPTYCQLITNTTDATGTSACTAGSVQASDETKLEDTSLVIYASNASGAGYDSTISNSNSTIGYYFCGVDTGVDLFYIDFNNSMAVTAQKIGTGC